MQEQNLPTPVGAENLPKPVEVASNQQEEVASTQSPESAPRQEQAASGGDVSAQTAPALPVSNLPQPIAKPADDSASDDKPAGPSVADDVDVIEKVWVDKSKSIVKETRDDPYEQERQVSGLQADYQKKRYGKTAEQQG